VIVDVLLAFRMIALLEVEYTPFANLQGFTCWTTEGNNGRFLSLKKLLLRFFVFQLFQPMMKIRKGYGILKNKHILAMPKVQMRMGDSKKMNRGGI
jgi:hypothetical protein